MIPSSQALPTLAPGVLTGESTAGGLVLTWTLPGPADAIHIHAIDGNGTTSTISLPGDAQNYLVTSTSQAAFWMTYTAEVRESLPSNPLPNYPCTDRPIAMGPGLLPVGLTQDCWCPMPVSGELVCDQAPELFK